MEIDRLFWRTRARWKPALPGLIANSLGSPAYCRVTKLDNHMALPIGLMFSTAPVTRGD